MFGFRIPDAPCQHPNDAYGSENEKGLPPPDPVLQRNHEQGRQRSPETARAPDPSLGLRALLCRKPSADHGCHVWVRTGFSGPEQKANRDERRERERGPGKSSESGPPDHNPREHGLRSIAIANSAGRNFKKTVREDKR